MVLRGKLENPAPPLKAALRAFRQLKLTPVPAPDIDLLPSTPLPQLRLTSRQIDELVAAYVDGATVRELAEHVGVNRKTVALHLKARGLKLVHSMNEAEIARATELYAQGWSLARVGDALGYDTGTIHNALRRAGVRCRDPQGRERR